MDNRPARIERLKVLSDLLDSKFQGPFGIRFGLDALLGLLPIFGDFVTTILSFAIIIEAALLGCPLPVLGRMVVNVLVENVMDFIPFLGNFFDFVWKSNNKNVALLLAWESTPHQIHRQSSLVLACIFVLLSGMLALVLWGGYTILLSLYQLILRAF